MNFKQQIDELCDYALLHSEEPEKFDKHDLSNATMIFNHVVGNLMWESSLQRNLTADDATERAINFGTALRLLVLDATGLDLHETFENPLDDEILET